MYILTFHKKKVQYGYIQCVANTDNTPVGYHKLGTVEWNSRKSKYWVNLYPKKRTGNEYWNYYCENPDTGRSKIVLHSGSVSQGRISVPDSNCWSKLQTLFTEQVSSLTSVTSVKRSVIGSLDVINKTFYFLIL